MAYKKMVNMEGAVKWFSELSNKDVSIAGGKGASLAEMYNEEFPVPLGFVITAQAFDYFISKSGLKEKIKEIILKINMEDTAELDRRSGEIRQMVEDQEVPEELRAEILEAYHILGSEKISRTGVSDTAFNILKNSYEPVFVAVRSSATTEDLGAASFAGAGETFVNTKGDYQLIENVKKCFSSLYTARGIYYRKKQGFGVDKVDSLLAVVVQKMVDSEKSGVVFSRDPITMKDDIIIEAVFGLGEGIVSGKINPDNYVVSRNLEIQSVRISEKKIALARNGSGDNIVVKLYPEKAKSQVLTRGEILKLADYALKLEEHYQKPQDIEFAVEEGRVYIVQSRPITTLSEKKNIEKSISGNIILTGQAASPGIGVGVVRLIKTMNDLEKIKKGDVLVTEMTNPDMVVAMQKSVAIVTDEGGMTSHAAIVSREMGIPCIVGTGNATQVLKEGMKITVDGENGRVYEGAVAETHFKEVKKAFETEKIKLKLILDLPDFVERAAESGLKDVGLQRIEGIIAESGKHPLLFEKENNLEEYVQILEKGILKIAEKFDSVWIRSSDIRTDEFDNLKGAPEKELNPMLGFHGIRFSLKHPEIFEAEIRAISEIASLHPEKKFGVMFPQIISLDEVKAAKEIFNKYRTENMEFGIMVETPAAVLVIEDICREEISFISFGTNDLTQFTLAIDRGNENVQYIYDEMNPAVLSEIKKVISVCKKYNVKTSICGQAGSRKEMIEFLFKEGIDSISVNADAAYDASVLIRELEEKLPSVENFERENFASQSEKKELSESEKESIQDYQYNQIQNSGRLQRPDGSENWSKSKWKRWKKRHRASDRSQIKESFEKPRNLFSDKRGEITLVDDLKHVKEKGEKFKENVEKKKEIELEKEKEREDKIVIENMNNSEEDEKISEEFKENQGTYGEENEVIEANFKEDENLTTNVEETMSISDLLGSADEEINPHENHGKKNNQKNYFDEYGGLW